MVYKLILFLSLVFLVSCSCYAQVTKPNHDSLLYSDFEAFSQKKKSRNRIKKLKVRLSGPYKLQLVIRLAILFRIPPLNQQVF